MIADIGRMASLDMMELNPVLDTGNGTAELSVDLVERLFGKIDVDARLDAWTHVIQSLPWSHAMNMKLVTLGAMLALLCAASTAALAEDRPDSPNAKMEESAARVPLDHYLKAHATGDGAFIHKAFHPTAKIMSFRDGKLNALTVEEFATRFNGKPAADEAQRTRRIQTLHMAGNAAAATIVLDYPTTTFTDYMALLKVDGEWKIVNKTFNAQSKSGD